MAISIAWGTKVISVPQADLTFISGTLYELDTEVFRLALKALEASVEGMPELDTHSRNFAYTIAGTTYAQSIEIINGYTITFEDGQYAVRLVGSNNNLFDEGILNRNQVSVIPTNAAGLILNATGIPDEVHLGVAPTVDSDLKKFSVWLDRDGTTVISGLVSAQISWYRASTGSLVFSQVSMSADAQGQFYLTRTLALADDTIYYADVTVLDAVGSITTRITNITAGT